MPETIFDVRAAEAARRDAEFRHVLDEMALHAHRRLHRPTRAYTALAPEATPPLWATNMAFEEIAGMP